MAKFGTKQGLKLAKVGSKATRLTKFGKVGGKAFGVLGGALSVGTGIYELAKNPNETCKDCSRNLTEDFCKRQCIACWTTGDNCIVPTYSNKATNDKMCAVICMSCNTGGAIVGNPMQCYYCFGVTGDMVPAHRELDAVHPSLKNSATSNTSAGLGIAGGVLAGVAVFFSGPIGWAVAGTSLAVGGASAATSVVADNDPNCRRCNKDVKTKGCQSLCRACGKLGDLNAGHPIKCAWIHPECKKQEAMSPEERQRYAEERAREMEAEVAR